MTGNFVGEFLILIGTSRSLSEAESDAKPMSFISAAAFQWVNPKAWVMAVTAMATYTNEQLYLFTVLLVGFAFAAVNVPSSRSCTASRAS